MNGLVFSHRKTVYTFTGAAVALPKPNTYDVDAWDPPTNKIYTVAIQDDGQWTLAMGLPPVVYSTGSGGVSSRVFAEAVIRKHAPEFNGGGV